jgi:hypothetical protein
MAADAELCNIDINHEYSVEDNISKFTVKRLKEDLYEVCYVTFETETNDLELALESEEVGCVKCGITEEGVSCIHQDYQTA